MPEPPAVSTVALVASSVTLTTYADVSSTATSTATAIPTPDAVSLVGGAAPSAAVPSSLKVVPLIALGVIELEVVGAAYRGRPCSRWRRRPRSR